MNREDAKQLLQPDNLAIVKAFAEGKEINFKRKEHEAWSGHSSYSLSFCFSRYDYRVKPEPVLAWVVAGSNGSVAVLASCEKDALQDAEYRNKATNSYPYTPYRAVFLKEDTNA